MKPPRAPRRPAPPRFPEDYLPYLAARAAHVILEEFHSVLRPHRMRVPEWRVLATLSAGESYTVGALARATLFKQPTLSKLLDRLEARGLVRRLPGGTDQRQSLVQLTPRGRRRILPVAAEAKRKEAETLARFRPTDVRAFKKLLSRFAAGYEPKGG